MLRRNTMLMCSAMMPGLIAAALMLHAQAAPGNSGSSGSSGSAGSSTAAGVGGASGGQAGPDGFPNPGPDVIVGDMPTMAQFGRVGSTVALAIASTSCNKGNVPLNWFAMPNIDHPVIVQNLYRLWNDRLEQIGQSWAKHGYGASQQNGCGFGCTPSGSSALLGVGCSDPYTAANNADQIRCGSRAWINPFTGGFPSTASDHVAHSHDVTTHLLRVNDADLDPMLNPGAVYYGEIQYATPHELASNNGIANNQSNNVSYRRFQVSGAAGGTYTFTPMNSTVRELPALSAWTGAGVATIEPAPGVDGTASVACKVTARGNGTWHYEYAVYNMNLDRGVGEFTVPRDGVAVITGLGTHGPPQHAGAPNDGTGGAGFSSAPWSVELAAVSPTVHWWTQAYAENSNANAVRWGTLYNFRFDSDRGPRTSALRVRMFKTGEWVTVALPGPDADCNLNGIGDSLDIHSGFSVDGNGNGVPDECEQGPCGGDIAPPGGNGVVNIDDLLLVIMSWNQTGGPADVNHDGMVNMDDLLLVVNQWGPCV